MKGCNFLFFLPYISLFFNTVDSVFHLYFPGNYFREIFNFSLNIFKIAA